MLDIPLPGGSQACRGLHFQPESIPSKLVSSCTNGQVDATTSIVYPLYHDTLLHTLNHMRTLLRLTKKRWQCVGQLNRVTGASIRWWNLVNIHILTTTDSVPSKRAT